MTDHPPWFMNVVVRPGSPAHAASVRRRSGERLAPGVQPDPAADLQYFGGKTIADLSFVNLYVAGGRGWSQSERDSLDHALAAAMSDAGLNAIIQQYFTGPGQTVAATMSPSRSLSISAGAQVFQDTVEGWIAQLASSGQLDGIQRASTLLNFLLPPGVVLFDGNSPGHQEAPDRAPEGEAKEAADSLHGLGGYHGSAHVEGGVVYYAVGVYSERTDGGENGIVAFDEPWKNVVATFYHELQEARTDADVAEVNRTGNQSLLGWYTQGDGGISGEIGDTPIEEAGSDLSLVFKELELADGSGTVPVQLMWSNEVHGPGQP